MQLRFAVIAAVLLIGLGGQARAAQQMAFICDLNGVNAQMRVVVEYVSSSGIVTGPGANPSITGVIPTGDYTIYTAGDVRSPSAYYTFKGQGEYADFTNMHQAERFRVRFVPTNDGLWMIINPHQPPQWQGRHFCKRVG